MEAVVRGFCLSLPREHKVESIAVFPEVEVVADGFFKLCMATVRRARIVVKDWWVSPGFGAGFGHEMDPLVEAAENGLVEWLANTD